MPQRNKWRYRKMVLASAILENQIYFEFYFLMSGASLNSTNVLAVVVCYFPDESLLTELVDKISIQVSSVLLLNNGGMSAELKSRLLNCRNVCIHDFSENKGIATALNFGFLWAVNTQIEFVITFDQDSVPPLNLVDILMTNWKSLAEVEGQKVGAIGPSFFDDRNGFIQYPFHRMKGSGLRVTKLYPKSGCDVAPVDLLITSGMLVPVSMWQSGLKFKEDLFIDYVDTEWCFRSRAEGYQHFGCFSVSMRHQVSDSGGIDLLGLKLLSYSAIRRYYYYRNTVFFLMWPYVPLGNKVRLAVGLFIRFPFILLLDKKPILSVRYALRGFLDGLRGRGGALR